MENIVFNFLLKPIINYYIILIYRFLNDEYLPNRLKTEYGFFLVLVKLIS